MKTLIIGIFALALSLAVSAQSSVPVMTSASSPSGLVTQSGIYSSSYPGWQVFDGNDDSMWISAVGQTPAWIGYEFTSGPRRVVSYAIKYVNGSIRTRAPKDWTLQAWNGSFWVVIDTRSNQIDWNGVEERAFAVNAPGFYSSYRLNITDDNDTRAGVVVISIGKLSLIADDIDWNLLLRAWHFDADLSTDTVDYYVPIEVTVPILRFVPAMTFNSDGQFAKLMLSPVDAHYYAFGSWSRTGAQLDTVVNDPRLGTVMESFTVLSLTPGVLRVQHK